MNAIIISGVWGVAMMLGGVLFRRSHTTVFIAIAGMILLLAGNLMEFFSTPLFSFDGFEMLKVSSFGLHFNTIAFFGTLLIFLLNGKDIENLGNHSAEYFSLIFFSLCGVSVATSYNTLLTLFLGIELMVVPLYFLVGSDNRNLKGIEASLKMFLTGAFFSAIILMGIALIYGGNSLGSMYITFISLGKVDVNPMIMTGMVLLLAGMAFKVSAAPFHFWAPDVYDGTPTVVSSFLSAVVQVGAFIAFYKLFSTTFGQIKPQWQTLLVTVAVLSMVIGNVTAIFQQSIKRMLAYAVIAQSGFLLLGLISFSDVGREGVVLFIGSYALGMIGMFAVISRLPDYTIDGFSGLGKLNPGVALFTTIFLLSLTGIPLTAGFLGKLYLLLGLAAGQGWGWLIILASISMAVSAVYYFRIIRAMYFREPVHPVEGVPEMRVSFRWLLGIIAAILILLGLVPDILTSWIYY
ncbi:MAG TPA: NADH-quinone oxidoreductase subunit N [Ginsengibacter sp.]|nr:NADH-quinone oxidoreductase subunit N [Ginsengibacter sp.]